MAKIQVKAKAMGYYDNGRRREGTIFLMDEKDIKKDAQGNLLSPRWVEIVATATAPKGRGKKVAVEEPEELSTDEVI